MAGAPFGEILFAAEMPAVLIQVRALRGRLSEVLASLRVDETLRQDFSLAFTEIANNIVNHAAPKASTIKVSLANQDRRLMLSLEDDGGPFEAFHDKVAAVDTSPLEIELVESGLGLFLIREKFPDLTYVAGTGDRPNRFSISRTLASPRPCILLLEDDPTMRLVIESYLQDAFDLVLYDDAERALDALTKRRVDLILTDIGLPGMNGLEFARRIGQFPGDRRMPVVFLTGSLDEETELAAVALGIEDYIRKPVQRTALVNVINRILIRVAKEAGRFAEQGARQLSEALTPSLPQHLAGLRTAVRSRSAVTGGGDLLFPLPEPNQAFFVIADVMGHGTGAKLMAHAFTGYFRGLARSLPASDSPGRFLRALSDAMAADDTLDGAIITAMAVYAGVDGALTIASAGHPPPMRVGSHGVAAIPVSGPLLGLMPGLQFDDCRLHLDHGQRLLLFTDGFVRPGTNGLRPEDLPQRVLEQLEANAGHDLETAANAAWSAFAAAGGVTLMDDVTIALLELEPA